MCPPNSTGGMIATDMKEWRFSIHDNGGGKPSVKLAERQQPPRFVKVRYYGYLETRNKKTKLALCPVCQKDKRKLLVPRASPAVA